VYVSDFEKCKYYNGILPRSCNTLRVFPVRLACPWACTGGEAPFQDEIFLFDNLSSGKKLVVSQRRTTQVKTSHLSAEAGRVAVELSLAKVSLIKIIE
jgi:hypothetical protein